MLPCTRAAVESTVHSRSSDALHITKTRPACYSSEETDMNRSCSLRNNETRTIYEGLPPQGLSEARRAESFLN